MGKKEKKQEVPAEETVEIPETQETAQEAAEVPEVNPWEEKYNAEHDSFLRLAADYDNFRKRSDKERENIYTDVRVDTVSKFLPVYDNLQRALAEGYVAGLNDPYAAYLTAEATEYLVSLGIKCLVTDGWSPAPLDNEKQIHQLLLRNHVGVVENVTLEGVADGDYTLIAFPVNFGDSDGAPCRAYLIEKSI